MRSRAHQGYRPLASLGLDRGSGPARLRGGGGGTGAFPQSASSRGGQGVLRSLSEGSLDCGEDEEVSYQCLVTCSSSATSEPQEEKDKMEGGRGELTAAQMEHLMTVIAGMESVKGASSGPGGGSPPPTDEEIRQFIDYMGQGVVNQERLDFEANREQPEPPKRSKTAQQYFWRRHYLSIIQEEEEHYEQTPGSSRPSSRPCSTYENSLASRLSRLGALSPLAQGKEFDTRGSWGSEMSVDSVTSINSILSEEGSITSAGSFQSEPVDQPDSGRLAPPGLSCLLELVQPPSCTPDSMQGRTSSSCESTSVRNHEELIQPARVIKPMGSKFKQQIKEIEEAKRKGKALSLSREGSVGGVSEVQAQGPPPLPPSIKPPPIPSPKVTFEEPYFVAISCQHLLNHLFRWRRATGESRLHLHHPWTWRSGTRPRRRWRKK